MNTNISHPYPQHTIEGFIRGDFPYLRDLRVNNLRKCHCHNCMTGVLCPYMRTGLVTNIMHHHTSL